jgi:hypothetical protein
LRLEIVENPILLSPSWKEIATPLELPGKRLLDSSMSLNTAATHLESIGIRAELAKSCLSTIGGENNY